MTQNMGATQAGRRRQPGPRLSASGRKRGLAEEALLLAAVLFAVGLLSGAGIGLAMPDVAHALGLKKEAPSISVPLKPGPQIAYAGDLPLPRVIEPAGAIEPAFVIAEPLRHRKGDLGGLRMADAPPPMKAEETKTAYLEDAMPEGELVTGSIGPAAAEKTAALPEPERALASGRPRISIIMDDLGLNAEATRRTIALPEGVTLSFLPYGKAAPELAEAARADGHEVMLHLPMEPRGSADAGPNALMADMTPAEIEETLRRQLGAFKGYTGVNNHMGSRFTEDVRALIPVMRVLKEQGLFFVDSRTSQTSRAADVGRMAGVPAISRDVFLDHERGPDHLLHQLQLLEEQASRTGHAVAIAHPHELTLEILEVWLRSLDGKGFDLVPVSALIEMNAARG